jgi:hypothetical protein
VNQPLSKIIAAKGRFEQRADKKARVLFIGLNSFIENQFLEHARDKTPFPQKPGKTGRDFWGMAIVIDESIPAESFRIEG